jgi:PAS domain S-box-containing protein
MLRQSGARTTGQGGDAATGRWWQSRRHAMPVLVALVLGTFLSITGWLVTARYWEDRLAATQLGMVAENRVLAVDTGFQSQVNLIDDLRGYFGSRGGIPRHDEFEAVTAYFAAGEKHPVSITWVVHVRDQDRAAFESQMRADQPGFEIRDRGPDGRIVAAARRPDYYPALFAGALIGPTPGLDLGTDEVLLDTVRHASAQAQTAATPARPSGPDGGQVISIVAPLFQRGPASNGVAGFVLGTFDLGAVLETVPHSVVAFRGVDTYLFDDAKGVDALPLYVRASALRVGPAPIWPRATLESGRHWTSMVRVADTHLVMVGVPVAGGPLDAWHPRAWLILLVLLLSTAAVAAGLMRSARAAYALEVILVELRRRDAVLNAVAASGAELVGTLDFERATATTLALVGRATGTDHVFLVRRPLPADAATAWSQRVWSATEDATPSPVPAGDGTLLGDDLLQAVLGGRMRGGAIAVSAQEEAGALRTAMDRAKIQSMLVLPALLTRNMQCLVVFAHSTAALHWSATEHELLRVVAELLGGALARHMAGEQLADAYQIVENGGTLLFRAKAEPGWPLSYVSENVSLYGYSAADLSATGRKFEGFIHPDDLPGVQAELARAIDAGQSRTDLECRGHAADGSYRWFEIKITIQRDSADQVASISGIMRDITERKQAQDALAVSHRLLDSALENSPDGVLFTDENDQTTTSNQRFIKLWSLPGELIGTGSDEKGIATAAALLKDPEEFLARIRHIYAHRNERNRDEFELKDGRFFERRTAPLSDAAGQYHGRIWIFRDITKRKQAEQAMISSNTRLTAALENSPDGIMMTDEHDQAIIKNARFIKLWGIPHALIASGLDAGAIAARAALLKDPEGYVARVRYIHAHRDERTDDELEFKDGRFFARRSAPLSDSEGRYLGRIWLLRDITERKQSQQNLVFSNTLLTAAMNSSPYGVLVVGPQSQIIDFNDRFVELMKIPPQLLSAGKNEPVLAFVTAIVRDSEPFLQRVRYIYEHPDERTHDRFVLKDGRTLERYTAPLYGDGHQYLGLICYFRDVAEAEQADVERLTAPGGAGGHACFSEAQTADQARQALRERVEPPATAA